METGSRRIWVRPGLAALVLAAAVGLSACGGSSGSSDEGSTQSGSTAAQTGSAGSQVKAAEQFVKKNAPGQGGPLPSQAPKPKPGFNLWVISCTQAASGCAEATEAVVEAGHKLGWNVTLVDGKADPNKWAAGIEAARVDHADAIFLQTIDCAAIKEPLMKAKSAGIIVEASASYDCDDPTQGGGEPLFTHVFEPGPHGQTWAEAALIGGELQAAWVIAHKEAEVKAVQFTNEEVAVSTYLNEGFAKYLGSCGSCEILAKEPFALTELGAPLTQKVSTALLKYPDANVLAPPYDPVSVPAAQAVLNAGKTEDVDVVGLLGSPENVELIREGRGQEMSVGWDAVWVGWGAVDDILRLAAGEKPVYSGWAPGIVDAENLPPEGSGYIAPVDYQANYEKIWGVG